MGASQIQDYNFKLTKLLTKKVKMNFGFSSGKKKTGPSKKWTEKEIESKLKDFDKKIEDAKEREGDVEVRDATLDKADSYLIRAHRAINAHKTHHSLEIERTVS